MTTTSTTRTPTRASEGAPPSVWRTVYGRALADKSTLVGVLAFYGLAMAVGMGALWPPLKSTFATIADQFPAGFDTFLGGLSIGTPAGWMHAEMASIMGPGFLIAVAMISAASATAGEEQGRTLGLVLSTGASRTRFLAAKTTAMVTHVLMVGTAIFVGLLIANPVGQLDIEVSKILAASVSMVLIALVYGAIALALGALTADKRLTLSITGGIFGVSFIAANFLGLNPDLEWLSKLNFWYPYVASPALADGFHWGYSALMVGMTVVIGAVAFVVFHRRGDLRG